MVKFKKIKNKRFYVILLVVFVLLYGIFHSKDYEVSYTVNDVHILEKFSKKEKTYTFLFQTKEKEFSIVLSHKYIYTKKLIKEIDVKEKNNSLCLIPKGSKFDFYPLCMQNDELISYHLVSDEELVPSSYKKEISYEEKSYKNMKLYFLNNKKYYIWNYDGFDVISDNVQQGIKLFKEDVYNIPLTIKVNNNLVIADYDSKYTFTKFYVLNSKNDKVKELSLKNEISFDSYYLGIVGNNAYLIDKKNKKEYEINSKRLLIENITKNNQGRILNYGTWEQISIGNLVNNETQFTYKEITQFKIENNTLYKVEANYQTRISDYNVKDIVYHENDTVYYLVDDKLYYYNNYDGEVLVLTNFEWNFNYKNMIYIF